jgi:response regulator NasT
MKKQELNILVIDEDPERATLLEEALVEAGYTHVMMIHSTLNLEERIAALAPDLVILDLQRPDRKTLEGVFEVTQSVQKPTALFVDESDEDMISRAVEAGVGAYVVDGLKRERVKAVVDLAVSRFESFNKLRGERDAARNALAERKSIDRAKGLLMRHKKLSEDEAYKLLRSTAMKQSRKIAEIAESVITAFEMTPEMFD